jgi:hypothetical protein
VIWRGEGSESSDGRCCRVAVNSFSDRFLALKSP